MAIQQRTIKGQPYLLNGSLMQDQILLVVTDGKTVREATGSAVIVEDVWEDLKNASGTWKRKKNYFYWEVEVSDTMDDRGSDATIKQLFGCPKPGPEVFDYNFEPSTGDSEWAAFWKSKLKATESSLYNSTNALYRKEVILPGTKYIKFGNALTQSQDVATQEREDGEFTSEEITVSEVTIDMDDTMNLLSTTAASEGGSIGTDLSDLNGLMNSLL